MSDHRNRWEQRRADRFFQSIRKEFAYVGTDLACTCSLCWATSFAAVRALKAVAEPDMDERQLTLAAWAWMHESPDSPWVWDDEDEPPADTDD